MTWAAAPYAGKILLQDERTNAAGSATAIYVAYDVPGIGGAKGTWRSKASWPSI